MKIEELERQVSDLKDQLVLVRMDVADAGKSHGMAIEILNQKIRMLAKKSGVPLGELEVFQTRTKE